MSYIEYRDGRHHSTKYPNGTVPRTPARQDNQLQSPHGSAVACLPDEDEMEALYRHFRDWTAVYAFLNID